MRNVVMVAVAVSLVAASNFGVINVSLSGSGASIVPAITLNPGDTATIYVWRRAHRACTRWPATSLPPAMPGRWLPMPARAHGVCR